MLSGIMPTLRATLEGFGTPDCWHFGALPPRCFDKLSNHRLGDRCGLSSVEAPVEGRKNTEQDTTKNRNEMPQKTGMTLAVFAFKIYICSV